MTVKRSKQAVGWVKPTLVNAHHFQTSVFRLRFDTRQIGPGTCPLDSKP